MGGGEPVPRSSEEKRRSKVEFFLEGSQGEGGTGREGESG